MNQPDIMEMVVPVRKLPMLLCVFSYHGIFSFIFTVNCVGFLSQNSTRTWVIVSFPIRKHFFIITCHFSFKAECVPLGATEIPRSGSSAVGVRKAISLWQTEQYVSWIFHVTRYNKYPRDDTRHYHIRSEFYQLNLIMTLIKARSHWHHDSCLGR
jgi:hypothetical protein